jgi:signal-transduction protein with cAMP-binding, CBS, and nucleotidyltransferase domain
MKTVKDILESKGGEVWWVRSDAPLPEAVRLMSEKDVGALIVKNAKREVVGIFSERDYARKAVLEGNSSKDLRVEEIMTPSARMIVVKPENTLDECMAIMAEAHIRHLPVVKGQALVGIVSSRDLIGSYLGAMARHIENLEELCGTFFDQSLDDNLAGHRG